jgi:hypothetical protein
MFLMQNILVETPGLLILDNYFWKYIHIRNFVIFFVYENFCQLDQ